MTTYVVAAIPGAIGAIWIAMFLYRHGAEPMTHPGRFFGGFALVALAIGGWCVGFALLRPIPDSYWAVTAFGYAVTNLGIGVAGMIGGAVSSATRE